MTRLPFLGIEWDIGALPAPFLYVQLALLFSKGRQQYYLFPSLPSERPNISLPQHRESGCIGFHTKHRNSTEDVVCYSLDVILVIFDPSRPMPPISPFCENTKA
jgi:hypothetical protein